MTPENYNPFIRTAELQASVLCYEKERLAYDYRIFYIMAGRGSILIRSEEHPLQTDTLVFVPPMVGYRFCGALSVAVLNFDLSRAAENRTRPKSPAPVERFDPALLFDRTRSEELDEPILLSDCDAMRERIPEIVREWNSGELYRDASTSAALKSVLVYLLKRRRPVPDPAEFLCRRVQGYIRLNAATPLDNRAIAEHFGYSSVYLGELFKQKTGKTLHAALLEERVCLSRRRLSETAASVDEIAHAVGFSSRNHFCTVFRKYTGMSPLEYRSRKNGAEP